MKKSVFIVLAFAVSFLSFAQEKKYMTFQAEIANRSGDVLYISNSNKYKKKIQVDKQGVFKDTMNVVTGRYMLSDGNEFTIVYLKNGFNLKLKMDAKLFDESIVYAGKGEVENNFLAKNSLFEEQTDMNSLLASSETDFIKGLDKKKTDDLKRLENKKLDPVFVEMQKKSIDENYSNTVAYYKQNHEASVAKSKLNNSLSPTFDYENYAGEKIKLEDFKGKYVYIDVWATWCGPCRGEIPFLQGIEKKYKGKNIAFISISVDELKNKEKWKAFVKEKELGGVQLLADANWNSQFIQDYKINSIPRFILIDPNGIIVNSDAARPSSEDLTKELDLLLTK